MLTVAGAEASGIVLIKPGVRLSFRSKQFASPCFEVKFLRQFPRLDKLAVLSGVCFDAQIERPVHGLPSTYGFKNARRASRRLSKYAMTRPEEIKAARSGDARELHSEDFNAPEDVRGARA
jgi:hypothetical protein